MGSSQGLLYLHITNTLQSTNHRTNEKEHQAERKYIDNMKDKKSVQKSGGILRQAFYSEGLLGGTSRVATHGETCVRWGKRRTGHPDV